VGSGVSRPVYVYRLVVGYPPGSHEPGWVPARWEEFLKGVYSDRRERARVRRRGFRWPRVRLYLSSAAAYHRAWLLEFFGARVDVQRSNEVLWWEDEDAMDWWPDEAAGFTEPPPDPADPLDEAARYLYPAPDAAEVYKQQAAFYALYFEGKR
jgi:hypothetical protein